MEDFEGVGRFIRRWTDDRSEDGEVVRCTKRGQAQLVEVKFFPNAPYSLPREEFEKAIEDGIFEYLDEEL